MPSAPKYAIIGILYAKPITLTMMVDKERTRTPDKKPSAFPFLLFLFFFTDSTAVSPYGSSAVCASTVLYSRKAGGIPTDYVRQWRRRIKRIPDIGIERIALTKGWILSREPAIKFSLPLSNKCFLLGQAEEFFPDRASEFPIHMAW